LALSKLFATNPILAIGLGALVIGSFVGFKVAAAQASKRQYATGGSEFIEGGSHASGNDTYLGFQSEGKPAYAERGEFHGIVRKEQVPKYRSLLPQIIDSLNRGVFENEFHRINKATAGIPLIVNVNSGTSISTERMEGSLSKLVRMGEVKDNRDSNGKGFVVYKNLTQKYQ